MPVLSPSHPDHGPPSEAVVAAGSPAQPPPTTATAATATQVAATDARPSKRRSVPWRPVALVAVAVAAIGVVVYLATAGDDTASSETAESVPLATVEAEQRDLVAYTSLDGTMAYATIVAVMAGGPGTVTGLAADGETLGRGDVAYEIDATPHPVFFGDTPLYRDLVAGTEGPDVLLLEENLASLGFHTYQDDDGVDVDTGFTVDGIFDAATTDAVRRFQEDYELAETGQLASASVVVAAGPAIASNVSAEVGDGVQAGAPLLELSVVGEVDGFYAAHAGELDIEASGPIGNGAVVYVVDDVPVTAVVSDVVFDRTLVAGVSDGDDVAALEQMLLDLGYDADGELVVDEEFDEATTQAIDDWEDDLADRWDGVANDDGVSTAEVVAIPDGMTIGDLTPQASDVIVTGTELATATSDRATRVVQTSIAVADQETLTEGRPVDVEFPDGTITTGVVSLVATSSTTDPADPDGEAVLAVEITLDDVPESAQSLNEIDVEVQIVDRIAEGATVVPASALLATADGGFAVEVVTGGSTTSFVAVDPGQFTDGFVEVTGIEPGTAVVVPR